uniref:Uncharacterized protein n=1 Tax=Rhizophora mucronata TaxID=61149 RepID=A0A2P2PQT6_RHIMU
MILRESCSFSLLQVDICRKTLYCWSGPNCFTIYNVSNDL